MLLGNGFRGFLLYNWCYSSLSQTLRMLEELSGRRSARSLGYIDVM